MVYTGYPIKKFADNDYQLLIPTNTDQRSKI